MKFSASTLVVVMLVLSVGESIKIAGEYKGCFVKNYEDKHLFPYSKVSRQMDNALCIEHCKAKGMPYAGTKSVRCGCGTEEQLASMTAAPPSECTNDCKTGKGICGGFARLSIYSTGQGKGSAQKSNTPSSAQKNNARCATAPCQNGATCQDLANGYNCTCPAGFTGKLCQTNINDCATNMCQNNATCVDEVNGFKCACPKGFTGNLCEKNEDDCSPDLCQNGATCQDLVHDFHCVCPAGFTGKLCQNHVDRCSPQLCQNDGICLDWPLNNFTCVCPFGFTGRLCEIDIDDCADQPCENGATCQDMVDDFSCICPEGFEGDLCEFNIDDCAADPCEVDEICIDEVNNFTCVWSEGFAGSWGMENSDPNVHSWNDNGSVYEPGTANVASGQCAAGGGNLARGRPTAQSSIVFQGAASRAVDGNRNPWWPGKSCTHTNIQNQPWWRVDLGASKCVNRVVVVNRKDCCSERLQGFKVHVGDNPNVLANPTCGGPQGAGGVINVNCGGLTGRYVGISLPGKQYLTLCEVEVYGGASDGGKKHADDDFTEVPTENTVAGMGYSDNILFLQTREKLKSLQEKVRELLKRAKN